eukprot:10073948-Prorocentrum_lima.AAC.1
MSKPEHLGPVDRYEKLKVVGGLMSRPPTNTKEMDEGAYSIGQGCYTLEVIERFNSSMHQKHRNTPGEPE